MSGLNQFQQGTANWRATLRKNKQRTYFVMFCFILVYLFIGLLFDLYHATLNYPNVPLIVLFKALVTFKLTPFISIITTIIAVVCIWVTFIFHDRLILMGTEYQEITAENASKFNAEQLYNVVEEMKVAAGLHYMPKIFIIDADYMNAFASGYSEKSAMVAITRGLFEKLDRAELTAVMAHELSHIRHMDIKLTLMASVLANLIVMLLDVLFYNMLFSGNRRSSREGNGNANIFFIIIMVLRFVLPLITVLLMLYLSRTREYMADAGAVELMRDNGPLARALLKIQGDHESNKAEYAASYRKTPHEAVRRQAYIFDPVLAGIEQKDSLSDFFSTHPGITNRLKALGFKRK